MHLTKHDLLVGIIHYTKYTNTPHENYGMEADWWDSPLVNTSVIIAHPRDKDTIQAHCPIQMTDQNNIDVSDRDSHTPISMRTCKELLPTNDNFK